MLTCQANSDTASLAPGRTHVSLHRAHRTVWLSHLLVSSLAGFQLGEILPPMIHLVMSGAILETRRRCGWGLGFAEHSLRHRTSPHHQESSAQNTTTGTVIKKLWFPVDWELLEGGGHLFPIPASFVQKRHLLSGWRNETGSKDASVWQLQMTGQSISKCAKFGIETINT